MRTLPARLAALALPGRGAAARAPSKSRTRLSGPRRSRGRLPCLASIGIHLGTIPAYVPAGRVVDVGAIDVVSVDVGAIDVVNIDVGAIDVVNVDIGAIDVVVVDVAADAVVVVDVVVVDVAVHYRGVDMDGAVAAINVDAAGVNVTGTGAYPPDSVPAVIVD